MNVDKIINYLILINIVIFSILFITMLNPVSYQKELIVYNYPNGSYEIICPDGTKERFYNTSIIVCENIPVHPAKPFSFTDNLNFTWDH